MFTNSWQRPLILAVASLAFAAGTAGVSQASESQAMSGINSAAAGDHPEPCFKIGRGGEGGKGGEGGRGGQPGQPGEPGKPGRPGCLRFHDLPDKKKSELTVVDRVYIVMMLTADDSDEMKEKISEKYDVPKDELDTWKKNYEDGNWIALMGGGFPF
ncbi:hypothetical protein [Streptomyces bambusae]|uniref:Uncharacterized protein n=1 Tax=Streptomyces bambusae TaxID=1550616 RepID=A0ABS6ZBG8_9ACTN|nr:hypothetical protein [Streptomyces bambusae]MBW5485113.1 hypothetical protein [Streptomyces bambusae]